MSDILARLKAVHEGRSRVKVHVRDYDMDLYFPPMTLELRRRCRLGVDPRDEDALFVNSLITMAQNEDGTPAFPDTPQVRAELHQMAATTLMWIVQASGGQQVSEAALAEIGAVDPDVLRDALSRSVGDAPELGAAIRKTGNDRLITLLREIAADHQAATPVKNG